MSKHTPGPWGYFSGDPDFDPFIVDVPSRRKGGGPKPWSYSPVANIEDQREAEANARLIAAAPELLEALQEILNYTGGADNALQDEYVMERAAAAIAKAEGN